MRRRKKFDPARYAPASEAQRDVSEMAANLRRRLLWHQRLEEHKQRRASAGERHD